MMRVMYGSTNRHVRRLTAHQTPLAHDRDAQGRIPEAWWVSCFFSAGYACLMQPVKAQAPNVVSFSCAADAF